MTDPADILQYRDLAGRLVLDSQTMAELGWVDTLWMYPQRNRVLGVVCRPGRFGAKRLVFKLTQLDTVGENSLLMRGDPEPTVAAKVQQLESLIGQEVWSDRGERVGKLIDCLFNPENGVILRYLMTPGPWAAVTDGTYLLSPKKIISFSAKRTLIAAADLEALEVYQPGLRQRLDQIRTMLKEEYVDSVTRELRSLSSQMQSRVKTLAERAQDFAQSAAQRAQAEMETLAQRTREQAQNLSQDLSRDAQEVVRTIQTEVQSVTERVEGAIPRRPDGGRQSRANPSVDPLEDEQDDVWGEWPEETGTFAEFTAPQPVSEEQAVADEDWEDWEDVTPEPAGSESAGPAATNVRPAQTTQSDRPRSDTASDAEGAPRDKSGLETDERDIWDDWDDEAIADQPEGSGVGGSAPTTVSPPDEPSKDVVPQANNQQATKDEPASEDEPMSANAESDIDSTGAKSANTDAIEDDDPWI